MRQKHLAANFEQTGKTDKQEYKSCRRKNTATGQIPKLVNEVHEDEDRNLEQIEKLPKNTYVPHSSSTQTSCLAATSPTTNLLQCKLASVFPRRAHPLLRRGYNAGARAPAWSAKHFGRNPRRMCGSASATHNYSNPEKMSKSIKQMSTNPEKVNTSQKQAAENLAQQDATLKPVNKIQAQKINTPKHICV